MSIGDITLRPKINYEQLPARFPEGTLARIDAVLRPKEKRSDLIRTAVEAEIGRRSGAASAAAAIVEPVEAVRKLKRARIREPVRGEPPAGSDDLMDMLSRAFKV